MPILPATGTTISAGRTYTAYTNISPGAGSNVQLRATLGPYIGITTGAISLSASFGGQTTPYTY